MKKINSIIAASLLGLGLAGCAVQAPAEPPMPSVSPIPTSTPSAPSEEMGTGQGTPQPTQETSDRGNLIKKIGQPGSMSTEAGEQLVSFVVTKIDNKLKCTGEFKKKPDNGHFVGVKMDVQTFKGLNESGSSGEFFVASTAWKFISTDGTTFNGSLSTDATYSCLSDKETLPATIGAAEKASGWIVLDVPKPQGTLIFEEGSSGIGWEWEFGKKLPDA